MSVKTINSVSNSVLKNFKNFQNLLLGSPAIFCEIYFCKMPQATAFSGIYFLRSRDKFATNKQKKIRQKLIPQKLVLVKINSLKVDAQVIF